MSRRVLIRSALLCAPTPGHVPLGRTRVQSPKLGGLYARGHKTSPHPTCVGRRTYTKKHGYNPECWDRLYKKGASAPQRKAPAYDSMCWGKPSSDDSQKENQGANRAHSKVFSSPNSSSGPLSMYGSDTWGTSSAGARRRSPPRQRAASAGSTRRRSPEFHHTEPALARSASPAHASMPAPLWVSMGELPSAEAEDLPTPLSPGSSVERQPSLAAAVDGATRHSDDYSAFVDQHPIERPRGRSPANGASQCEPRDDPA